MRTAYVVSPMDIVRRAVASELLTFSEFDDGPERCLLAAEIVADRLRECWPEGEGYGSSDFTATLKEFLDEMGIANEYRDSRLCRKEST